jgi:hypothetical protein
LFKIHKISHRNIENALNVYGNKGIDTSGFSGEHMVQTVRCHAMQQTSVAALKKASAPCSKAVD